MMKPFFWVVGAALALQASAHDGGHGPKLTDAGRQGGVVSPVILEAEVKQGAKAVMIYKAELVRSEDGTVRVYIYDAQMKPIAGSRLGPSAQGVLEFKRNKKWERAKFELRFEEGAFVGMAPKPKAKPFNIDIHLNEGGRALLSAFDNLD